MVTARNIKRRRTTGEQRSRQVKKRREYLKTHDPRYYLWKNTKNKSRMRGQGFNLTVEDLVIPDKCPVLGIPLTFEVHYSEDNYPTVDRIDNDLGYVRGNVRVISWRANWLKSNGSLHEFKRIVKYMKGKL